MSLYRENLINVVIEASERKEWQYAVNEWEIFDWDEDEKCQSQCICGKENIRYLFTIRNIINGNILFPIGSQCIKKFQRTDLNQFVTLTEEMFKLLHAIKNNEFLSLKSGLFSRKLLEYLYDNDAFKGTIYNNYDGERDYLFMLDMFNKRTMTDSQNKKTVAIILNSIKPFLKKVLKDKE